MPSVVIDAQVIVGFATESGGHHHQLSGSPTGLLDLITASRVPVCLDNEMRLESEWRRGCDLIGSMTGSYHLPAMQTWLMFIGQLPGASQILKNSMSIPSLCRCRRSGYGRQRGCKIRVVCCGD